MNPLVSIIIPSFNQGRYLRATLDSIFAQDYRPLEVIVMDGGSKDDTVAILTEYAAKHPELRFRSERDKGPADAVNKGLAEARGEFAGIQSSDDVYVAGAIREAVAELQRDESLGVVCADMDHVDAAGQPLAPMRPEPAFSHARFVSRSFVIHQSSAFFRLALAKQLGGWNAAYFCCDTDLWLRMSFRAGVKKVDRRWSERRMHPDQRDTQRRRMCEDWDRMIDDTPELKAAPLAVRLAARAGRHLIRLDYNPGLSAFGAAAHGWLAVLCYPPVLWHMTDPALLVPGLAGIRDRLFRGKSVHA